MSHDTNLYLHLFHGRRAPDDWLNDWGIDGPWIGPLIAAQTTYAHTLKLMFVEPQDALTFGLDPQQPWLHVRKMMLLHSGIYFGEWEVCTKPDAQDIADTFATLPTRDLDTALISAYDARFELDEVLAP